VFWPFFDVLIVYYPHFEIPIQLLVLFAIVTYF